MYDSVIDYDNIPSREVVLDKGYYEGATIILNDFCYSNVKYNNDYKISELVLPGDEGIIQSIDTFGILHVLWKDQYEVPVIVGRDTFKLKTQDIETENNETGLTVTNNNIAFKNYKIYGQSIYKENINLINSNITIEENTKIDSNGNIYNNVSNNYTTDYIEVNSSTEYIIKGNENNNKEELFDITKINNKFISDGNNLENYRIYGNTVERKNLLQNTAVSQTVNGVTFTVNDDGSVTANGTATATANFYLNRNLTIPEGDYIVSLTTVGSYSNLSKPLIILQNFGDYTYTAVNTTTQLTVTSNPGIAVIQILSASEVDCTFYPMIRKANIKDSTYEPYIENTSVGDLQANGKYLVPVTVSGKNLLKNTATSQTINGMTFTVNDDGSVTCNGTAVGIYNTFFIPFKASGGTYILNGCPKSGSNNSYRLDIRDSSANVIASDYGEGTGGVQLGDSAAYRITIRLQQNYICDNLTFYPMIRPADITATDYEPYHEPQTVNIELDEPLRKVNDAFDYVDFKQQKLYQKIYCKILTGNETWFADSNAVFRTTLKIKEPYQNYTSTEYTAQKSYGNVLLNDKSFCIGSTAIVIHDEIYAAETKEQSLALFVAALKKKYLSNQPVKIYYSNSTTEKSVLLPTLPTIDGTTVISVNTETQPFSIKIQNNEDSINDTVLYYDNDKNLIFTKQQQNKFFVTPSNCKYIKINTNLNELSLYDNSIYDVSYPKYIGVGDLVKNSPNKLYNGWYKIPVIISDSTNENNKIEYNIYLDEPIMENEYIDFKSQSLYNDNEKVKSLSLPRIVPSIDAENITISVNTTVQPSKIVINK